MNKILKRLTDIIVSGGATVVLLPVMVFVALMIVVSSGFPIFYVQERPGLGGRPFCLVKFRSMNSNRNQQGNLLPGKDRLTVIGKFIRRTSLDELPQLFNVLKGDMSLVGPRPLLMEYMELYSREQMRRHEVKPGITGWAQINGRNQLGWEESFRLDVWYVDNHSWRLDMKILLLTIAKVLRQEGESATQNTLRPRFTGSKQL